MNIAATFRQVMLLAGSVVWGVPAMSATTDPVEGRGSYVNQRFGFSLVVPDSFDAGVSRNPELGGLWISRDRRARLIAVATANESGESMAEYRAFVMRESYKGASFDYAPVREDWFVLSGRKGGQMFYERITFACGGRYIYGWQLYYPVGERRRYDRIVEQIHRSYRAGQGEDGQCGPTSRGSDTPGTGAAPP